LILIVEPCDLTIPNVITPNGDGFNDYLTIPNIEYYPNSSMVIYNRWGKKVFESTNYSNEWDGDGLADGVYYFVFTINYGNSGDGEQTRQVNGTVTILR
jgi:gliding motility-associated-like protein